jgi:hypothetical protein
MVEITLPIVLQIVQTAGILVGIVYYITIMRNQQRNQELTLKSQQLATETRQAQLFLQMYNRLQDLLPKYSWEDLFNTPLSGFEEYLTRYESDGHFRDGFNHISNFYEALGVLLKAGYLDIHIIALMWANMTTSYWNRLLKPSLDGIREHYGRKRVWSEAEYVCRELEKYLAEHPELEV